MAINLSTSPYFDDFDEFKNFHQLLFKPGLAVQSRELTQLQTIIRNQIQKFGDHVFKHGSVVIPGNSFADLAVPYVKVESEYLGNQVDLNLFTGRTLVGVTSGVKAVVKKIVDVEGFDPVTIYISYISGGLTGGVANGNLTFLDGEELYVENNTTARLITKSSASTGVGSLAFVNPGVYYINGTFVSNTGQSVVISKYNSVPSCHVLFKINERVVDFVSDSTLLDPAQGSYNFAAPGADRLQIDLELVSLPLGSAITQDYVELMRYDNGVLLEHARYPRYNELEKTMARRLYDESGNFVVDGLRVAVLEHKKTRNNGGVYPNGDVDKLVYNVEAGKAYVSGFEIENLAGKRLEVDKARTAPLHIKTESVSSKTSYGQYILISDLMGGIDTAARVTVDLYNTSATSGGTKVGTAKAIAIDYLTGDGSTSPIFKLYVSDLELGQYSLDDVGGIRVSGSSAKVVKEYVLQQTAGTFAHGDVILAGTREATVSFWASGEGKLYAHKNSNTKASPRTGDVITSGSNTAVITKSQVMFSSGEPGLIFELPRDHLRSLKNEDNEYDFEYTAHRKFTLVVAGSGGTTSAIANGTIVPIEAGTFAAFGTAGLLPRSDFSLSSDGKQITYSGTYSGTINIYTQLEYDKAAPRPKTATTAVVSKAAAQTITLDHADVYSITSIIVDGVDIKNFYILDPNITDYEYKLSRLVLAAGIPVPVGTLTITYKYFAHGSGDFFSVDSYATTGLTELPFYVSPSTGISYNLSDCIDFRSSPAGTSNVVVSDSVVTTTVQRYLGRVDSICISPKGALSVLSGYPADNPKPPIIPEGLFELEQVVLPPYTRSTADIVTRRTGVTRYRMQDISLIEDRIDRLEEFTTLTAVEASLVRTNVLDAESGLDRFKTGYIAEDCTEPFGIAAWDDPRFKAFFTEDGFMCGVDVTEIELSLPQSDLDTIAGGFELTGEYRFTGGLVTLPYTEKVFAEVATSSRVTNLNPYLVVAWRGEMVLIPPSVDWVEVVDLPAIVRQARVTLTQNIVMRAPDFRSMGAPQPGQIRLSAASVANPAGALTFEMLGAGGNWNPVTPGNLGTREIDSHPRWGGAGKNTSTDTISIKFS